MQTNETLTSIRQRRSVRSYKADPLPQKLLSLILEMGQAAPYVLPDSRQFSVIQDKALVARLSQAAKIEGMKLSESHRSLFSIPDFDGTYRAPVVVLVSGKEDTMQFEAVCAASVQNMLIAATSLGIASCWAYFPLFVFHGPDARTWKEALSIPEGFLPCAAVLLGYGTNTPADVPEEEADSRYKNAIVYVPSPQRE